MGLRVVKGDGASLAIGERWVIEVEPTDDAGCALVVLPTLVVTLPGGTTAEPTFERITSAWTVRYRATYAVANAGRHIAIATATGAGTANAAAYVSGTTAGAAMPVLADLVGNKTTTFGYLGKNSWTDADVQDALDAEAAAQRAVCRVGAVYPADLRQALLRRTQRNLAMRRLPLGVQQGDAEAGGGVLPGNDPEVRRLERPYRKVRAR